MAEEIEEPFSNLSVSEEEVNEITAEFEELREVISPNKRNHPTSFQECLSRSISPIYSIPYQSFDQSHETSYSQESTSSDCCFRKFPLLSRVYTRNKISKRFENSCSGCHKIFKTNDTRRLGHHARNCTKLESDLRKTIAEMLDDCNSQLKMTDETKKVSILVAEFLIENNVPVRSVDSVTFKKLVSFLKPGIRIHSRQIYSDRILHILDRDARSRSMRRLAQSEKQVSVEFDHWKDATSRNLLAIVLTFVDGSRYLSDLRDVSLCSQTGEEIASNLEDSLESISISINSIVSDSASGCKKAREIFVVDRRFSHVIQHRCLAHLLNRLGNHLTSSESFCDTFDFASKITCIINKSPEAIAILRQNNKSRIHPSCDVRWYSSVNMIESLLDAKEVILNQFADHPKWKDIVEDHDKWNNLKHVQRILRPIANAIGQAERGLASLGESFRSILELGRWLMASDWRDLTVLSAITSYLVYVSEKKLGTEELELFLACYLLDPRFKTRYLTQLAIDMATSAICKIAIKTRIASNEILSMQLEKYQLNEIPYSRESKEDESAYDWWIKDDFGGPLKLIAIRLAMLRPSSANIERVFSTLKNIQGQTRNNLHIESLLRIGRAKIELQEQNNSRRRKTNPDPSELLDLSIHNMDLFDARSRQAYLDFLQLIDFSKITLLRRDEEPSDATDAERVQEFVKRTRERLNMRLSNE